MYKTAVLLASLFLVSPLSTNLSQVYGNDSIFSKDSVDSVFSSRSSNSAETDQKLQKDIQDKISSGWFSEGYEGVSVKVKDGHVTLDGHVKTNDDKGKVEKEVRGMEGVRALTSNIKVQQQEPGQENKSQSKDQDKASKYPQDTAASPTDLQLNYKIRDQISGWFWDSYKGVSLNTADGVVEVRGEVDTLKDEQKLMKDIQDVEGVKSVKSALKVKENK